MARHFLDILSHQILQFLAEHRAPVPVMVIVKAFGWLPKRSVTRKLVKLIEAGLVTNIYWESTGTAFP